MLNDSALYQSTFSQIIPMNSVIGAWMKKIKIQLVVNNESLRFKKTSLSMVDSSPAILSDHTEPSRLLLSQE